MACLRRARTRRWRPRRSRWFGAPKLAGAARLWPLQTTPAPGPHPNPPTHPPTHPNPQFNPAKRLTAAEALAHPFVAQFHSPDDEPSCSRVITIPINDNCKYSISDYRWAGWGAVGRGGKPAHG